MSTESGLLSRLAHLCVHVCVQLGQRSAYQVGPAVQPVDLDEERLSGQVGDLFWLHMGMGHLPAPFGPEVRLVWWG